MIESEQSNGALGEWAELVAIEDWDKKAWPTGEECMEIYNRCCSNE